MASNFSIQDINVENSVNDTNFLNPPLNQILAHTNIITNINQLSKEVINSTLNLSFYDIALTLEKCQTQLYMALGQAGYLQDVISNKIQDQNLINKIQNYNRRFFSNFCNNPNNLVDSKGKYIGDKYGIRIVLVSNDGWIVQDVQTFCKDVKNAGPSFTGGTNNNYISYLAQTTLQNKSTVYYNPSIIAFPDSFPSYSLTVNKSYSSDLPTTSVSTPNLLNYILIDSSGNPTDEIPPPYNTILKNQTIENHGTRYEIQLSRTSLYGYASRRSDTVATFNFYVSKNLGVPPFALQGTAFSLRLSFFEWDRL
jgi:hypothetical protein